MNGHGNLLLDLYWRQPSWACHSVNTVELQLALQRLVKTTSPKPLEHVQSIVHRFKQIVRTSFGPWACYHLQVLDILYISIT